MGQVQWPSLLSRRKATNSTYVWFLFHIPYLKNVSIDRQTRQITVPSTSALAVHTRSAQLQDKVEQQHLKRLVLDYEQREEAEELKGMSIISDRSPPFDSCGFKLYKLVTAREPSKYATLDEGF